MAASDATAREEQTVGLLRTESHPGTDKEDSWSPLEDLTTSRPYQTLTSILSFLVPSFLHPARPGEPVRATAWLDGLRGVTAFCVYNTHLGPILCHYLGGLWGLDGENYTFLQTPIVALIYAGSFSVVMFFIISGYALSLGAVKRMNQPTLDAAPALRATASAILRRPFRLLGPCWASTIIGFTFVRLGLIERARVINEASTSVNGWPDRFTVWPSGDRGFFAQILDLIRQNMRLLLVFDPHNATTDYNTVLWTISIEMRASMYLYLVHVAFFYLRRPVRIALAAAMVPLGFYLNMIDAPMFFSGYILCELDYMRAPEPTPSRASRTGGYVALLFAGLWTATMPEYRPGDTPGFRTLNRINPLGFFSPFVFWHMIGAIIIFFCISRVKAFSHVFAMPLTRYLGRISFSLYLVHLPLVAVVGTSVFDSVWGVTGIENPIWAFIGFVVAYSVTFGVVVCVADVFCRLVDDRCITLGKTMENLLVRSEFTKL